MRRRTTTRRTAAPAIEGQSRRPRSRCLYRDKGSHQLRSDGVVAIGAERQPADARFHRTGQGGRRDRFATIASAPPHERPAGLWASVCPSRGAGVIRRRGKTTPRAGALPRMDGAARNNVDGLPASAEVTEQHREVAPVGLRAYFSCLDGGGGTGL
jgi:hypothetical protein